MRRLSVAQERVLAKCGDRATDVPSRVHKRLGGAGAPYSWAHGIGMCSTQTRILSFSGYIELGAEVGALRSAPWYLTDRGREYLERFPR